MPNLEVVDRHGVPIEKGHSVEIQHCVGRYGQTQLVKGIVVEIDPRLDVDVDYDKFSKSVPLEINGDITE